MCIIRCTIFHWRLLLWLNFPQVARFVAIPEMPSAAYEGEDGDPAPGLREIRYRLQEPRVLFRRLGQEKLIELIELTSNPRGYCGGPARGEKVTIWVYGPFRFTISFRKGLTIRA